MQPQMRSIKRNLTVETIICVESIPRRTVEFDPGVVMKSRWSAEQRAMATPGGGGGGGPLNDDRDELA